MRLAQILKESRTPQEGAYWWFPRPTADGIQWDIAEFFASEYPHTLHYTLWPHVVQRLALAWDKDAGHLQEVLSGYWAGLPRGRVEKGEGPNGSIYSVYHGGDPHDLRAVVNAFNLFGLVRLSRVRFQVIKHERMDPEEHRRVMAALGVEAPSLAMV